MNKNIFKIRRQELGMTMKELADAVGVSEATVSRWESGKIADMRCSRLIEVSNKLEISPLEILQTQQDFIPITTITELPKTNANEHLKITIIVDKISE